MNSRTAQRYPAPDTIMVHVKSRDDLIGRICDISQGGMAFEYVQLWDDETLLQTGEKSTINILKNGAKLLDNATCTIAYCHTIVTNSAFPKFIPTCRCGLQFQSLTPNQVDQLENILVSCGAYSCV